MNSVNGNKIGKWLDSWGPRASNLAQIILCGVAIWSLFYTVIPLYRLSVTDNELAEKTLELKKVNERLATAYDHERNAYVQWFVRVVGVACTDLGLPARFTSTKERSPHWQEVLFIDTSKCANERLMKDKDIALLTAVDRAFIAAELDRALGEIKIWREAALEKCRQIETAPPETIPERPPDPPGSFAADLRELMKSANVKSGTSTVPFRREYAQSVVADDFRSRALDRLLAIENLKWPDSTSRE
jgi:hypothetical protein